MYLTNEAGSALLEDFAENGFREAEETPWTMDLLIEYTDSGGSLRCQKLIDGEDCQKTDRFFPPTIHITESEKIQFSETELEGIHDNLEAFLDGEVEVTGIPADEDHDWIRIAVLLRRLLRPCVQNCFADSSHDEQAENAGLYVYCTEGEIETRFVTGKDRPDLTYGKLTEEGEVLEETGRYYDDELYSGEALKRVIKELECRPKYLADPEGIQESIDLPPQLLENYQCARLVYNGRLLKSQLASRVFPVTFRRKDFLWNHPIKAGTEHIYITVDTLLALPEAEIPLKYIPNELLPEAVIEIIDSAFTCRVEIGGERQKNTQLSLYCRFAIPQISPVYAEAGNIRDAGKNFLEDGPLASDGKGYLGDVAFSLLCSYKKILGVVIAADWFGKHGKTESEQSGILIEAEKDGALIRRVTGRQRPELICTDPEGERVVFRPYKPDDEYEGEEIAEHISFLQVQSLTADPVKDIVEFLEKQDPVASLEQKVKQNNPLAIIALASRYVKGEGVPKDLRKALELYEKAFILLPDNDDLEFEIFMLKMEVDNQQ